MRCEVNGRRELGANPPLEGGSKPRSGFGEGSGARKRRRAPLGAIGKQEQRAPHAGRSLNFSLALISASTMPGSVMAWPLSGTMTSSASGQTLCKSQAIVTGVQRS